MTKDYETARRVIDIATTRLREDLLRLIDNATRSAPLPQEPPVQSVLKFTHHFEGNPKTYTYVAIRSTNGWHVSGRPLEGRAIPWSELAAFIGDEPCWIASDWSSMPGTENSAPTSRGIDEEPTYPEWTL